LCEEWDIYRELEEHLYAEALGYYSRGELGKLREVEERAEKLGADEILLERIAELRAELERRLAGRLASALAMPRGTE
jgi:hypothetical protein